MGKNELPAEYKHVRLLKIPYVAKAPWVDGDLRDPAWKESLSLDGFLDITAWLNHFHDCIVTNPRQFDPEPVPAKAVPGTRVLCCHDGTGLYLGFICHDPDPKNILQRDIRSFGYGVEQEDCVHIWLDPAVSHLQPCSCEYIINAAGQKTERLRGRTSEDYDSLMAWEGRVRSDSSGWTAEVVLPLDRLGLSADSKNVFGLNFGRGYRGTMRTHALLPFDGEVRSGWGIGLLLDRNGNNLHASINRAGTALARVNRVISGCALPTEPAGLVRKPADTQDENAMIGMSVWGPDHQPTISIGRSDSYDRRWFGNEFPVITRKEVVAAAMSGDATRLDALREQCNGKQYAVYPQFPAPKPVGQAILLLPGGVEAGWITDVAKGDDGGRILKCHCKQGEIHLILYVHKRRNLIVIEGSQKGFDGRELALRLYRHNDAPLWRKSEGCDYEADIKAGRNVAPLPQPKVGADGNVIWLCQDFYADRTFPKGFFISVFGCVQGAEPVGTKVNVQETGLGTPAEGPYEGYGAGSWFSCMATEWNYMNALPGSAATMRCKLNQSHFRIFLPVLSTNDGKDLHRAQKALLSEIRGLSPEVLANDSRNATEAERAGSYLFRQDLPLSSVGSSKFCASDTTSWHGDLHFNELGGYACFPLKTPSFLEPYFQMIEANIPAARAFAREAFGCKGAAWGVASFPMLLDRLPQTCLDWDYSMEITGLVMQPFWLSWLYNMDRRFLKERAYPVIREGAIFYADYVTLEKDGRYHLFPCVSSEHVRLQPYLKYNHDSIAAISMVKFILNAAVEAARALKVDESPAKQWTKILERLAPYPTEETPEGPRFVDVADAGLMTEYNIPQPLFPVFFGNDIGLASSQDDIDKARRSLKGIVRNSTGPHWGHVYRAKTRLGIWYGGGIGCENLLQSHQGPLFLFPAVPAGYSGEFKDHRARGAFLVSAQMNRGRLDQVNIISQAGGKCVLDISRFQKVPAVRREGAAGRLPTRVQARHYLCFETSAGGRYAIQ